MKTNNPANINSQNAKKADLSYWSYMEKTYHCVHNFAWGTKKQIRQQKKDSQASVNSDMARSTNPRMRFLSQMRNLLGGRSY